MSIASLKAEAKATARRAGLLSGGLLVMSIGVAFLTVAAWIYLATVADTLTAASVIGAAYLGLGLIIIGISAKSTGDSDMPHQIVDQPQEPNQPPLMQAFMYGMSAGSSASKSRNA